MDKNRMSVTSPMINYDRGRPRDNSLIYTSVYQAPKRVLIFATITICLGAFVIFYTQNLSLHWPSHNSLNQPTYGRAIKADASNCSIKWIEQRIDHFTWLPAPLNVSINDSTLDQFQPAIYKQRYLVYDQYWDATNPRAPIFFYTGNEGDVSMYANHTGLMWENAKNFNALIVFAEHRYYGQSQPFGPHPSIEELRYLSHEQALADYLVLIYKLQQDYNAENHPIIAFGGSYGGMLSAWFRMMHPTIITGAIAASAPIFAFQWTYESVFNPEKYWEIVTQNASPEAGSAPNCIPNIRKSWTEFFLLAKSTNGLSQLSQIFQLCEPLSSQDEAMQLALSIVVAFDTMAMGNYPYASSYLTEGVAELPPWPVRVACSSLSGDFWTDQSSYAGLALLAAVKDASNVYLNASKTLNCIPKPTLTDSFDGIWDYQFCTQLLPQETYFSFNGEQDMFWSRNVTWEDIKKHCQSKWHTIPDTTWTRINYGSSSLHGVSNIVFSNGKLDPWSSGGVHSVGQSSNITIINIENGAHHLDLFFSHKDDPASVKAARILELQHIESWINQFVETSNANVN